MIGQFLRQAEWRELGDLLAPSFFQVVPGKVLWKVGRELYGASRDERAFADAVVIRERSLREAGLPIRFGHGLDVPAKELTADEKRARGELVLALYFHEVLGDGPWLFDFRFAAFSEEPEGARGASLAWSPKHWFATLTPDFRRNLANVYRGFYGGDDARFKTAIAQLGLSVAEAEFRAQFGGDDQRNVRFSIKTFQERFTAVFRQCRDHGVSLGPDFLYLGMGLALLHEHLDALAVPLDVRGVFEKMAGSRA